LKKRVPPCDDPLADDGKRVFCYHVVMSYKRMLAPPDHARRVDVPDWLVPQKLKEGWVEDPHPDDRPVLHRSTPGRHNDRCAFVLASGPSAGMYPVEQIREFTDRKKCVTWATNNIFNVCNGRAFQRADYLLILDESFFNQHQVPLLQYLRDNPKCLPVLHFEPMMNIRYHRIVVNPHATPDREPAYECNKYFHGNSSGCAAVQMAMHTGCKTIYLLGHDLTTANGRTHGHGVRSKHEYNGKYPQGRVMMAGYNVLAKHAKELGVRIINLSPVSEIECFDREEL
jgi:hypothetical protein